MNPEEKQMRPHRVVLVTNIPSPYRIPFFRELSYLIDFHVVFDAHTEGNRHWDAPTSLPVKHSYARGLSFSMVRRRKDGFPRERRELHLRYGVMEELIRLRPDLVVSQELGFRSLVALFYCTFRRVPLILWQEGTLHTEGWVGMTKRVLRRHLCSRANRVWGNGVQSAVLVHEYAPEVPTDDGMTGVDTTWFAQNVRSLLPRRDALRKALAVRKVCFLFVGQLVERKGLRQMLDAVQQASEQSSNFTLLLAGEGPLREEVDTWRAAHPECDVRLMGHLSPHKLVELYAIADVFVLPSLDDNWALSTLEGAVAGLPQIFSTYNGAFVELMACNVDGELIDPLQVQRFVAAILHFTMSPPARLADEVIDAVASYYSPQQFALRAAVSIEKALRSANRSAYRADICPWDGSQ